MNTNFKDSGIAWIGQISKHWEVKKAKFVFKNKKEIIGYRAEFTDRLALTLNGVIKRSKDDNEGLQPEKFETYQILRKNNLVFKLIDLKNISTSRVGISNFDFGIVSPAYIILQRKENNKFFYYFYMSMYYRCIFNSLGDDGVRSSLNVTELLNLKIPYPPLNEQKKIAEFLDKKCEIIDKRVENLERKINTLKEYKKSLISECVTKGLNSRILEFKDSKIPWIGQIPKHWEVKRLKYIATKIYKGNGITKEQVFENGDTPCVRYGEIYTKYSYSFDKCLSYTFEKVLNSTSYFGYGDILFTCTGERIEEIGKNVVYLGDKKCLAGGDIIVLSHKQNPSFLNYALDCNYARNQKSYGKAKLKVVHISSREISNLFVVLPPLNEQKEIAEFLDKKCEKIDRLNENYTKQISTLKEYKKSLIYECVTGKKEI